jgi:hypothetical protein
MRGGDGWDGVGWDGAGGCKKAGRVLRKRWKGRGSAALFPV